MTRRAERLILSTPTIGRKRLESYMFWGGLLFSLGMAVVTVGIFAPFLLVWVLGFGQWYSRRSAHALEYSLTPDKLIVKRGVFFVENRAIPLSKITDVSMSQGILERRYDLWRVKVQTASSGAQAPEGLLLGLTDPQGFKERVLAAVMSQSPDSVFGPAADRVDRTRPVGTASSTAEQRLERIERLLADIADNTRPRAA